MNIQQSTREEIKQIKIIRVERRTPVKQNIEYKDFELAFIVRQLTYHKMIAFDTRQRMSFQQEQIKRFLTDVLKENINEMVYLIKSVFRYDMNGDGIVEYDQLINFCMEQHLGEITIQRLQKQKIYGRGVQRMMNKDEFLQTIKIGLSFLDFKHNFIYLQERFSSIDTNQDGYINYQEYFQFLKDYFGSKSYAAKLVIKNSVLEVMNEEKELKRPIELDIIKKYAKLQKNSKIDNNNYIKQVDSVVKIIPESSNSHYQNRTSQSINKYNFNYNLNTDTSPRTTINSINNNVNMNSLVNNVKSPRDAELEKKKKPSQTNKIQLTLLQKNQLAKESKFFIPFTPNETNIGEKIAKMVFMQVKASVIACDLNKDCLLTGEQIWNYLKLILQLNESTQGQIFKRNSMSKQKNVNVEEAMRLIMSENIIKSFKQMDYDDINRNLSMSEFSNLFERVCRIVPYTPLMEKFNNLYRFRTQKSQNMTVSDAHAVISYIFASYPLKK